MRESQKEDQEDPNEALVEIFSTEQESEAMVVQSLLESADIEVLKFNLDAPQDDTCPASEASSRFAKIRPPTPAPSLPNTRTRASPRPRPRDNPPPQSYFPALSRCANSPRYTRSWSRTRRNASSRSSSEPSSAAGSSKLW